MCCGRTSTTNQYTVPTSPAALQASVSFHLQTGPAFEYTGATALTVIGPVTGARYRFNRPGSRAHVDPRDSAALAKVPVLKSVN